jgi:hypothetical protein
MSHTNGLSDMNDFEKPFRDALTDLEVAPPEGGWPPIHAALDRKGFDYRTYGLLLLLLLLVGVGSLVTYHVATHALEQQRAATVVDRAGSPAVALPTVSSSPAVNTVEVPCANTMSSAEALTYADARGGSVKSDAVTADPREEMACTPSVDAGQVNDHALASHTPSQQPEALRGFDDDATTTSDISHRIIRRAPRREASVTTQRSAHTNALAQAPINEMSGRDRVQRSRTAPVTSGARENRSARPSSAAHTVQERRAANTAEAREQQAARGQRWVTVADREHQQVRNGEYASGSPYARATPDKSPATAAPIVAVVGQEHALAKGNATILGKERTSGSDSVIQAYNGPPMPVRKRNTPSTEAAALVPFESLENIREEEKTKKTPQRDSVEEKKREEHARSKWSLQVQGGVNYTFKKMDPAKDLYYVTGLNNKNQASWQNAGYQVGVMARYLLARRTTLTAGMSWSMLREHTDYNYYNIISDSVEVRNITGKAIEVKGYSKVRTNGVTNTLYYLGVHVGVIQQVRFLHRERNILLGFHVNRQLAATHRTQNADHHFTVNAMRASLHLGLEHRVALSPHHVLTFTPFIEQSFGSVYSKESVYTLQPIQLGLDVGLVLPFYRRQHCR